LEGYGYYVDMNQEAKQQDKSQECLLSGSNLEIIDTSSTTTPIKRSMVGQNGAPPRSANIKPSHSPILSLFEQESSEQSNNRSLSQQSDTAPIVQFASKSAVMGLLQLIDAGDTSESKTIQEETGKASEENSSPNNSPSMNPAEQSKLRVANGFFIDWNPKIMNRTTKLKIPMFMPHWGNDFWRIYGNKLRVNGTQEEVCMLGGS
jgi:hypothetical protein